MSNPQDSRGVQGGQPAQGGSPAPKEAEQAASKPFGASASDAEAQGRVPYDRFKQVVDQMKGMEAELAQLRSQPKEVQAASREGYDEMIEKWQGIAEQSFQTDPSKYTRAMAQIGELQAQRASSVTAEKLLQQQAQQQFEAHFKDTLGRSWDKAQADFPDLRDMGSDLYKTAAQIYDEMGGLKSIPEGMYLAAELADARRRRVSASPPPALEGSRSAPPRTGDPSFASRKAEQAERLRSGDKSGLSGFLGENFKDLLFKDGR